MLKSFLSFLPDCCRGVESKGVESKRINVGAKASVPEIKITDEEIGAAILEIKDYAVREIPSNCNEQERERILMAQKCNIRFAKDVHSKMILQEVDKGFDKETSIRNANLKIISPYLKMLKKHKEEEEFNNALDKLKDARDGIKLKLGAHHATYSLHLSTGNWGPAAEERGYIINLADKWVKEKAARAALAAANQPSEPVAGSPTLALR